MKKRLPKTKRTRADKAALKKDLTDLILVKNFKSMSFEFAPKDKSITLRLSKELLEAVQAAAKSRGTNYQKLIREAIERFLKRAA